MTASGCPDLSDDPAELAEAARLHLREAFLRARVAISGANFAAADTGTICVVESEGNGRMCTTLPEVLITVMSRVMLAMKTLASTDLPGKTLIFDEVDAGIGGRVADVVGARLRRWGGAFQVLCITHLPQVAAFADTHFLIEKRSRAAGPRRA